MRVVAGSARSILLETPAGRDTRPTTDRIKETLFNMLQPYVAGADVLDLFGGSGGLGIEALSRGAASACFSDMSREAIRCIEANLKRARLDDKASVLMMDYRNAILKWQSQGRKFDLVILDPPYNKGMEFEALRLLDEGSMLEDALIVVETSLEHDGSDFASMGFETIKLKEYKTNKHYFLQKSDNI